MNILNPKLRKTGLLASMMLAILLQPATAGATTRNVSNLNDSGAGSLRQTIIDSAAGDTIIFSITGTITLTSGELAIGRDLTISGPGANLLTVSGNKASRVFEILSGAAVNISGLTISEGLAAAGAVSGGGIHNSGNLVVNNCAVSWNQAGHLGYGGGVDNSGALTLNNCTVSANTSYSGGGIFNSGNLTANNCTLSGNNIANDIAEGGGIFNSGTLTLNNCTISGNSATGAGGGIFNYSSLLILNTIVAGNTGGVGGGLTDCPDVSPDVGGSFNSQGHNLIGKTNCSSGWIESDLTGSTIAPLDPLLGPLQDNGGPTFTMRPLPGSAAIDAGDDSIFGHLFTDQRGRPRWIGADVDIGAVEVGPTTFFVSSTNDSGPGSLRQAISDASPVENDTIRFNPSVTGTITLTSGELVTGKSMTISGPGAKVLTVSGNNASGVFHITGGSSTISGLRIANGNTSGAGGGVLMDAGLLNLNYCTVAGCYAGYAVGGGGIFVGGSANLYVFGSTISGNSSPDYGGGLYLFNGAYANVFNSTISGNRTLDGTDAGWGGGIFVQSSGSTLEIFNSTVANNSSVNAGGGIYRYQGTVTLANTLVAGNAAPSGPDCQGTFVSSGYNLVGNSSGSTGFGSTGDQLNVNPLLGPLADNGGPTFTHALLAGSPAIDKGKSWLGATTDQRGLARPYDFPSIPNAPGGDGSDIGAFELQPQAVSRPLLTITLSGSGVVISWPSPSTGFVLQQNNDGIGTANWSNVLTTPNDNGTTKTVTVSPATGNRFYRLKQ